MKVKNSNTSCQVNNPMEKTCAAKKNRTTDNMWVEKKADYFILFFNGEVLRTERSPMMY